MAESGWRLPPEYAYAEHLNACPFAWEFLRRNDDYRLDFAAKHPIPVPEASPIQSSAAPRWGLRCPRKSQPLCPHCPPVLVTGNIAQHPFPHSRVHSRRWLAPPLRASAVARFLGHPYRRGRAFSDPGQPDARTSSLVTPGAAKTRNTASVRDLG